VGEQTQDERHEEQRGQLAALTILLGGIFYRGRPITENCGRI
jgi:hypothetical protein